MNTTYDRGKKYVLLLWDYCHTTKVFILMF
jgi:hypothetical protein